MPIVEGEEEPKRSKPSVRARADAIKPFVCKNLIAVIEDPSDIKNIGTVIRNVNALGVEKVYVVDPRKALPDDWQAMRERGALSKTSVSAVKWSFVRRFDSTDDCFDHLEAKNFHSVVTSPHVKGQTNVYLHEHDFTEHAKLAVWFGSGSDRIRVFEIYLPNWKLAVLTGHDSERVLSRIISPVDTLQLVAKVVKAPAGAKPGRIGLVAPKA